MKFKAKTLISLSNVSSRLPKARGAAGFTLLELLIAMAVVTVGVLATVTLLTSSIASAQAVRNEVIAANLAQEALEVIHNVRDLNVAAGRPWYQDMTNQTRRVDALNAGLIGLDANPPLNLDANGFYTYQSGTATSFRRTVTFGACGAPCTSLSVTVTVMWPGRTFSAQSVITGWR
ncbi:prepilin-type N-terminal cleavage/methylation domain-containing protein [Candidatus Parcubacteria bacterium]|nr:prepilin-type N-terminal cleavage/methylation domain-containing protein [Candidatus Parcubacteria bacterium]